VKSGNKKVFYEVTAPGFYGGDDATDDLVLWVAADSEREVQAAIQDTGATFWGEVEVWASTVADYELPCQAKLLTSFLLKKPEHRDAGAHKEQQS